MAVLTDAEARRMLELLKEALSPKSITLNKGEKQFQLHQISSSLKRNSSYFWQLNNKQHIGIPKGQLISKSLEQKNIGIFQRQNYIFFYINIP